MGIAQAALDILAHALIALARQREPHVDGGVAIARAHDGRILAVQILHIARQRRHILHRDSSCSGEAAQMCTFHSVLSCLTIEHTCSGFIGPVDQAPQNTTEGTEALHTFWRVMTTPQGTGAPMNLWPDTDTEPMGFLNETLGAFLMKGICAHKRTPQYCAVLGYGAEHLPAPNPFRYQLNNYKSECGPAVIFCAPSCQRERHQHG